MRLHIIYHFQSSFSLDQTFRPATYKVLYCFNENEFIDQNLLLKSSTNIPEADVKELTFVSLDDLKEFAKKIMLELEIKEAVILSAQDFNIAMDSFSQKNDFLGLFNTYGERLSLDLKPNKKKLLGKIFT